MDHASTQQRAFAKDALAVERAALTCIECRRPWLAGRERWRLKVTDDEQPQTVPYCPDCATREFGDG